RAKAARARADRAHDHDGRSAGVPALADVRAARLLTDRRQPMRAHRLAHEVIAGAKRQWSAQPRRLARQPAGIGNAAAAAFAPGLDAVLDGRKPLWRTVFFAAAHGLRDHHDRDVLELIHGTGGILSEPFAPARRGRFRRL